jgi:integration host factor subunit beta
MGSAAVSAPLRGFGMIKSDLVQRIWQQTPHLRVQDAEKIVGAIFDEIIASLARGKRIELRGFGTFSVTVREARTSRNPRTGAPIPIPKKAFPRFKAAKEMKERLNRREE